MSEVDEFLARYEGRVACLLEPERFVARSINSSIEIRDGVLCFVAFDPLYENIRDHEIGHVIAATDEELLLPNLGLATCDIPHNERNWEQIQRTELLAQVLAERSNLDKEVLESKARSNVDRAIIQRVDSAAQAAARPSAAIS